MSDTEFKSMVLSQYSFVQSLAYKISGDYEHSLDLTQETMFKAFKNRNRFQIGTNIKGWLYTIVRNAFINHYRKEKKQKTFVDSTDNNYFIDQGRVSENYADSGIKLEEVKSQIDHLDTSLSEPFMMYFNGFKYEEIAEKLDLPLGTVKSRIFKARKKLQEKIDRY